MGFKTTGKLHVAHETKQITERFRKREFVIELDDNPRYPQFVLFQLIGDRCEQLDGMEVGTQLEVDFSLRGREWTSPAGEVRFFNSLDVWEVRSLSKDSEPAYDGFPPPEEPPGGFDEDLPF